MKIRTFISGKSNTFALDCDDPLIGGYTHAEIAVVNDGTIDIAFNRAGNGQQLVKAAKSDIPRLVWKISVSHGKRIDKDVLYSFKLDADHVVDNIHGRIIRLHVNNIIDKIISAGRNFEQSSRVGGNPTRNWTPFDQRPAVVLAKLQRADLEKTAAKVAELEAEIEALKAGSETIKVPESEWEKILKKDHKIVSVKHGDILFSVAA